MSYNIEIDASKLLACYVSFDPAINKEAMGADYALHFGEPGSYGNRDPRLIKLNPGKRASVFHLRPLKAYERAQCDSLPTPETKWLRAISYCLVRAELSNSLTTQPETIFPKSINGMPGLDEDALDYLFEKVGFHVIYEVGAVAYSRSRLGFIDVGYAPLPHTSVLAAHHYQLHHVAILNQTRLNTTVTNEQSVSVPQAPMKSEEPGDVIVPENPSDQ